jgi:hypothetical protein
LSSYLQDQQGDGDEYLGHAKLELFAPFPATVSPLPQLDERLVIGV